MKTAITLASATAAIYALAALASSAAGNDLLAAGLMAFGALCIYAIASALAGLK